MAKLLIVEDDEALVRVYRRALEGDAHEVRTATDYAAAGDLIAGEDVFDLAILDFWVGTDSSLGFLRALRKRFSEIPVIYVSGGGGGLSLEVTAALAETGGASDFLVKPIRPADMCAAVRRLL